MHQSLLFIADFVQSILLILALKKYQAPLQRAQVTRRCFNSNIRWIRIPFPIKQLSFPENEKHENLNNTNLKLSLNNNEPHFSSKIILKMSTSYLRSKTQGLISIKRDHTV